MLRRSRGAACVAVLLVLGLFLALPGVVLASENSSNHAVPFLRMGAGTRALGMGGAAVAAGLDATAGYWNPALLGWTCGSQVSAMHALGMDADRRMSFVAGSHRMDWGALGASFLTAGMSDIDGRDESGYPTGDFNYGDLALMVHGAYTTDMLTVGATLKYLHQGLDADVDGDDGVSGYGFGVGAAVEALDWLRVGFVMRDLATRVGGDEDANNVPINLRAGVSLMPLEWMTFALDLDHTQNEAGLKFHAGGEAAFPLNEDFSGALRLGLNDGDLTAGLGVTVRMVEFNYAFLQEPQDFLGESHRIGVTLKFNCEDERPFERAPRSSRDGDLDGILDEMDACPTAAEDFDGFEDSDGCPDVDNDGDGILDVDDDCPTRAEDFDGFEDSNGCPDLDNDGDGILDAEDLCPNVAETFNGFEDEDGCPDQGPQRRMHLPAAHITFHTNSADISGADPVPILDIVIEYMQDYPDVRLCVIGHTDSIGDAAYNRDLSKRRADSVRAYLITLGADGDRLDTDGKGESEPIETNDTVEGRARNRRIQFEIVK